MCDPLTIIEVGSLALGVGSTIAGANAQNKAAKQNRAAAIAARNEEFRALGLQEQQVEDAAQQSIMAAHRTAVNAEAQTRVSAGEAGVAGASVQAILADISSQDSAFKVQTERNVKATTTQIQQEKRGVAAGAQSRINAVQPASPLATGLTIVSAGLDFAANQIKIRTPAQPRNS
jgi:hypothetical protein